MEQAGQKMVDHAKENSLYREVLDMILEFKPEAELSPSLLSGLQHLIKLKYKQVEELYDSKHKGSV